VIDIIIPKTASSLKHTVVN